MPLIESLKTLYVRRSSSPDWTAIFVKHGLHLDAHGLAAEHRNSLTFDRNLPGFGDFAEHAIAALLAHQPAPSLLPTA